MSFADNRGLARRACVLFVGLAVSSVQAAIPASSASQIKSAPPEIRDYLVAARAADGIADPLARCLAFPDFPGNQWPTGLAKAHCEYEFGPRITLAQVRELLDKGAVGELDALFAADLDKHYATTGFSEVIHADFRSFDASYDAGKLSKAWLEKAPNSAYAMVARGNYYLQMARAARGVELIHKTPAENVQRMDEFSSLAVDMLQRALKVEPRLIHAHVGLLHAGQLSSLPKVEAAAWKAGSALDPACKELSNQRMWSLTPRWGGNYPAMLDLTDTLVPYLAKRPLLALNTVWPRVDAGETAWVDKEWETALAFYASAAADSSHPKIYEDLGLLLPKTSKAGAWQQILYFVAASRFREGDHRVALERGKLLYQHAHDGAWALRSLRQAVASDPDDTYAHFLTATALAEQKQLVEAEAEFLLSMKDPKWRQKNLAVLVHTMMVDGELAKARKYNDQYIKEYPDDPWGYYDRGYLLSTGRQEPPVRAEEVIAAWEKFLALIGDANDLRSRSSRTAVEANLQQLRQLAKPVGKTGQR